MNIFRKKPKRSKPFSKEEAVTIAMKQCFQPQDFGVIDSNDHTPNIYNAPEEPCWYIYPPRLEATECVGGNSRVIAVSKVTGEILYDGVEMGE